MVERKSVVAHIHEWEENRAKGKREKERVWEMWRWRDTELLKEKMKEI